MFSMGLKEELKSFGESYKELQKEAFKILRAVDSEVEFDRKEWDHDVSKVLELAEEHDISTERIKSLKEEYVEIWERLKEKASVLKEQGLENIRVGPKTILAEGEKDCLVIIEIEDESLTVDVSPQKLEEWDEEFDEFARELEEEVEELIKN